MKSRRSDALQFPSLSLPFPVLLGPFFSNMSCLGPPLAVLALWVQQAVSAYDGKLCNEGSYTSPGNGLTCKTCTPSLARNRAR